MSQLLPRDADVVVIGGGISGLASAYYLAKSGKRVVVIEKGIIAGEASGRNGGHVSPSTYDPAQRELGRLAISLWPALDEELELPTEYRQDGSLGVWMPEEGDALRIDPAQLADPADPGELLSASDVKHMLPGVREDVEGGVFRPLRGNVNPILASKSIAHGARAHGAVLVTRTAVTGIQLANGAIAGVETDLGYISAGAVINCAGAWASLIGDMVQMQIPVIPHRLQIMITHPVPRFSGAVWHGNEIYARQALSGHVHFGLGRGPSFDPPLDRFDRVVSAETTLHTARKMAELMPGIAHLPILRAWAGVNSITPDWTPVVDAPPEVPGFFIAAGFWNGFGAGIATGKVISELVLTGRASIDIGGMALSRFANHPDEILYPFQRFRAASGGTDDPERWTPTGVPVNAAV